MFAPLIASHSSGCRVRLTAMDVTPVTVRFLGSGDAFGSGGRFHACTYVRSSGSTVLLDCCAAPPFALRLEIDGRTIAYSGDTEWTHTLIELARGADLFICEANFYEKNVKFHLDYETLMAHRDELRCKRLILTHMNAEMIARVASLDVEAAEDGKEIVL